MTEEERKEFYAHKIKTKQDGLARAKAAMEDPSEAKLIIDLAYDSYMHPCEFKSLASQLGHTMSAMKKNLKPFSVHAVNVVHPSILEQFDKRGSYSWYMHFHKADLTEVFDLGNTVYLSPDAEEPLLDFDDKTNFIIGGLIDRTVIKGASLSTARKLEIPARRLPLDEFYPGMIKKALSINQVAEILVMYRSTKDWGKALEEVVPERYKKQLKGEGLT